MGIIKKTDLVNLFNSFKTILESVFVTKEELQNNGSGGVAVDSEMSDSSANPVANNVVKKYIDDKCFEPICFKRSVYKSIKISAVYQLANPSGWHRLLTVRDQKVEKTMNFLVILNLTFPDIAYPIAVNVVSRADTDYTGNNGWNNITVVPPHTTKFSATLLVSNPENSARGITIAYKEVNNVDSNQSYNCGSLTSSASGDVTVFILNKNTISNTDFTLE